MLKHKIYAVSLIYAISLNAKTHDSLIPVTRSYQYPGIPAAMRQMPSLYCFNIVIWWLFCTIEAFISLMHHNYTVTRYSTRIDVFIYVIIEFETKTLKLSSSTDAFISYPSTYFHIQKLC